MVSTRSRWTDRQTDQFLGTLLRAGVFLAAVIALGGGVLYLTHHGTELAGAAAG